jgi:DnaJ-class molecular chaperone
MKKHLVKCNKCNGEGEVLRRDDHFGVDRCPKCLGTGMLDWIENVVGKAPITFEIDDLEFDY